MSNQPTSKQHLASGVSYKVGEECSYWLKFGEYIQQQAAEDGLLDAGKLTQAGLQVIISEQELVKKRVELMSAIKLKARSLKGRIKLRRLRFNTPSSPRTRKQTRSNTKRKYR